MPHITTKTFIALSVLIVAAIVILYLFTAFNSGRQTAGKTEQTQGVEISQDAAQPKGQQTGAVDESIFLPPPAVLNSICRPYSDLPTDVVPCKEAYTFMARNYSASLISFALFVETDSNKTVPFTELKESYGAEALQGKRLFWYGLLEYAPAFKPIGESSAQKPATKAVVLDAYNLAVIKEITPTGAG